MSDIQGELLLYFSLSLRPKPKPKPKLGRFDVVGLTALVTGNQNATAIDHNYSTIVL